MWLAKRSRAAAAADTDLGTVTISGQQAGVMTRGEVRMLPVFGPGGCIWMPEDGDTVLVLKGGPGGVEQCVAGKKQADAPEGMLPGELCLRTGNASVWLRRDGSIRLEGTIDIRGELTVNGIPYAAEE